MRVREPGGAGTRGGEHKHTAYCRGVMEDTGEGECLRCEPREDRQDNMEHPFSSVSRRKKAWKRAGGGMGGGKGV